MDYRELKPRPQSPRAPRAPNRWWMEQRQAAKRQETPHEDRGPSTWDFISSPAPSLLPSAPLLPHHTHIGAHDAALGRHEDEADEDGGAQHAHGTHKWVGPLGPQAAPAGSARTCDHTQETREAGDGPEDEAVGKEDVGGGWGSQQLEQRDFPSQGPSPIPLSPQPGSPVLGPAGGAVAGLCGLLHNLSSVQVEWDPHAQGPCGEGHSRRGQGGEDVAAAGERPGQRH